MQIQQIKYTVWRNMRYKIIDVFQQQNLPQYIAQCLKQHSPRFIIISSSRILCKETDIIDVDFNLMSASWATGENIALNILHSANSLDKFYESDH